MKKDILHGVNPRRTFLLPPLVLSGLASAQMASTAPTASYSVVYLGGDAVGRAAIKRDGQVPYGPDWARLFHDGSRLSAGHDSGFALPRLGQPVWQGDVHGAQRQLVAG